MLYRVFFTLLCETIKDWHAFTEKNTQKKKPTDGAENSGDNCVSVNDYKLVFFTQDNN